MLSCQVESFERAIPELRELFPAHWQELALFQDHMPLAPQYDEYTRREREGALFLTTARKDGAIVAYYITFVTPGLHYADTLTGQMDIMYVVPGVKGQGISFPLMRCVEAELKRRRAQVWYSGWKAHRPQGMDRLHALLGFQPADVWVAKWIGDLK